MPTYQYACTECGHQLEAVQSFTDGPLTECPNCGGKLRKVFSAVGVVFKGSGFYRTDSRNGSSSSTISGEKSKSTADSAGSSSGSGDGAKSDSAKSSSSSSTTGSSGSSGSSGGGSGASSSGSSGGKVAASA